MSRMYVEQAKQLEQQAKYKEAERLYVTVREPDLAIAMYKNKKMWNDMIRLVKINHNKEMVQESYLVVAKVCGIPDDGDLEER
mgnify:CR=1 FL=1